jgi:hypothetical protein
MKKYFILAITLIAVTAQVYAAPLDANTDLAAGKTADGSFSNPAVVTDGKIKGLTADSGDITDTPQYLTIDLGKNLYLDRVKIYWDKAAYSNDFVVKTSADAKYWEVEGSNLDASTGVIDNASGTIALTISLKRAVISSRYVQVMVPAGTKVTNAKANNVKITEVQVYPSLNQKFTLDKFGDYAVTDKTCIIKYTTSIGAASGTVVYGTDPNKLDKVAINAESGAENSAVLTDLKPRTTYFYQIKTTDFYGNAVTSKAGSFATAAENIALKKKVMGTFTIYPPKDKYVTPGNGDEVLSRITDGKMSYFNSMATSGPVPASDQYVVIDLGSSQNIKSIVTYWRKLAYPESLTVQVSNDNSTWTTLASGVDVGSGAFVRSEAGDPLQAVNITGASCRYIKLLIAKGSPFFHKHAEWDYVQLAEVQAFGQ